MRAIGYMVKQIKYNELEKIVYSLSLHFECCITYLVNWLTIRIPTNFFMINTKFFISIFNMFPS